jgi:hypothetical protein
MSFGPKCTVTESGKKEYVLEWPETVRMRDARVERIRADIVAKRLDASAKPVDKHRIAVVATEEDFLKLFKLPSRSGEEKA